MINDIFSTLIERRAYLSELLVQHILLSLGAIIIISVIGISTVIGILHKPKLRKIVLGMVNFLYTIPSIAMFGLFIPLIGIGYGNALLVLILYGLLPMIRNTFTGLNEVDPLLLDAAKGMGLHPGKFSPGLGGHWRFYYSKRLSNHDGTDHSVGRNGIVHWCRWFGTSHLQRHQYK